MLINLSKPWPTQLPTHQHYGHELTFTTRACHHSITYAYSSHRSSSHKKYRSTFFLSWRDYEESAAKVVSIQPFGSFYTLTPASHLLVLLLQCGKPITHERAHTLRLHAVGELVENNISLPMAQKIAELDVLLRLRSGLAHQCRNTKGLALSLLALFRVQQQMSTGRIDHRCNTNLHQVMKTQILVFGDVLLANFNMHCTDHDDRVRALELYEIFARVGMGSGDWKLAAGYWNKKFEILHILEPHSEASRTALGMLGKVYEKAGLHEASASCLRQSLRRIKRFTLPGVQGLRVRHGVHRSGKKNTTCTTPTDSHDDGRNEDLNEDGQVLSRVYLHLQQYDHAESMLLDSMQRDSMQQDSMQQQKTALADMYTSLSSTDQNNASRNLALHVHVRPGQPLSLKTSTSDTTMMFTAYQLRQIRNKHGIASEEYQTALEKNH